jgi:hypothetical protein
MNTPLDTEARALHRIVRLPASLATDVDTRRRLCDLLRETGVFARLSWPDAQMVADAVTADIGRDDGVEVLRNRARKVLDGYEDWDDRNATARALTIAADVLASVSDDELRHALVACDLCGSTIRDSFTGGPAPMGASCAPPASHPRSTRRSMNR